MKLLLLSKDIIIIVYTSSNLNLYKVLYNIILIAYISSRIVL